MLHLLPLLRATDKNRGARALHIIGTEEFEQTSTEMQSVSSLDLFWSALFPDGMNPGCILNIRVSLQLFRDDRSLPVTTKQQARFTPL